MAGVEKCSWPPVTLASFVCALACWYVGGAQTLPCMLWAELCGSRLVGFSCTETLGTVRANPHDRVFVFRRTTPQKMCGSLTSRLPSGYLFPVSNRALHSWLDRHVFVLLFLFLYAWHPTAHPPRSSLVNGNTYLTDRPLTLGREHPARHFSAEFPGRL